METSNRTNRTWLCSVIFMDIVGYSLKSVSQQAQIKGRFNAVLSSSIRSVAPQDRIILDTGDGAAICFLGDPEDVLFAALELRAAFVLAAGDGPNAFEVRIGVNLGPVKLLHDVNGSLNAIGDGINVAQRVMSFAEPNCVLVSRSFYEVVGCLSEEYEKLFQFEGTRKDKHVREHTVYTLQVPDGATLPAARFGRSASAEASAISGLPSHEIAPMGGRPELKTKPIEDLLAEYVGPLARILVKRSLFKASSAEELVGILKEEIQGQDDQTAFVKRAQALNLE
jgi:class 3 adenylate cyclase